MTMRPPARSHLKLHIPLVNKSRSITHNKPCIFLLESEQIKHIFLEVAIVLDSMWYFLEMIEPKGKKFQKLGFRYVSG